MAGPNALRKGVERKSITIFDPADAFDADEVITDLEITTPPGQGSATVTGDLEVRYVAPDQFIGDTSFAWRMEVDGDWTSPATVRIRVGRIPRKPYNAFPKRPRELVPILASPIAAGADEDTTAFRTPVTIDVLANDTGENLRVVSATEPAGGTVTVAADGSDLTYTPSPNFTGVDSFTYVITDGPQKASGLVEVTVEPPLLVATNDAAVAIGPTPVIIFPLVNDIGDSLLVTAVGVPSAGTATVSDGGQSITYRANYGYFGDDSFTYTITDSLARTSTGTVMVTVQRPPIAIVGNPATTTTTTPVVIPVLANDVGLGLEVTGIPFPPENGTAVVSGGGQTVTYTANGGFTGVDAFSYRAEDDYGQSGTAEVTVNVTGATATILAVNDTVAASAGVTSTLSPLANDVGSSIEIASVDAPSQGGTAIRTNGNSQILYTPLPTFEGTETIRYTITNGSSTSSATITATVGAASSIFAVANDTVTTSAGVPVTFAPLANDTGSGLAITRIRGATSASVTVRNDDTTVVVPPPANGKFSNGYSYRFRVRLPKWTRTGTMTNFVLPFSTTQAVLRTTANSGFVEKAGAWDVRFETTTGTKLGHRIARYVATTGELVCFVNLPRDFGENEVIYLYFGNSLVTATQEDAALTRAGGWLALYAGNSGTDFAGTASRNLTPTSAPPSGSIGSWPAADLDGTADCLISTTNNALGLNGQSAVTVISFHQADSTALKHEIFNIANGAAAELSFHFNTDTNNRITATAKFGATVWQMQSSNSKQVTTPQSVAVAWEAGQAGRMAINGALDTPGSASGTVTAGTTLNITRPLEWGRGGRGDLDYWDGEVAALMFYSGAMPTAGLESITRAFTTPADVFQVIGLEAARDIIDNPFNKRSSHHRPIGAGAVYYIKGGVDIVDYNAGGARRNTYAADLSPADSVTELRSRIGEFRLGDTAQGRKYNFRVTTSDTNATWNDRDSTATVVMKTPDLQTTTGGPKIYVPPYSNADFEYGFAPVDGITSPFMMQRFNKCDYAKKEYTSENLFDMSLTDNYETAGGLTGGAGLKWPGLTLRGHEINPENPLPIRHAFNVTGTRHSRVALDQFLDNGNPNPDYLGREVREAHILSRGVLWPASRTDGSCNPGSSQFKTSFPDGNTENKGPLPYGSLLCIRPQDRTALYDLITTARGRAMIDAMIYYGCYVVDGQGQLKITNKGQSNEKVQGVLQMRIDGRVGLDEFGRTIPNVISQVNQALNAMIPYLYVVGNRLLYAAIRAEDAPNGNPYTGGAKTLTDGSKQWVLDADNPDRSLNDAYDAVDGGWYEGG